MPGPNWHKEIERSELPHGWIGLTVGISDKSIVTIEELANTFDENHVPKWENTKANRWNGTAFDSSSTFKTDSIGIADPAELFNWGKGKEWNKYVN
jgi:hypothetical protein